MQVQELERTTITVAQVYQPQQGKRSGKVKDTEGRYFDAWPKQLAIFQEGASYDIGFTEKQGNSTVFRDIKEARPVNAQVGGKTAWTRQQQSELIENDAPKAPQYGSHVGTRNGTQYWQPKPTNPADARRIFICGIVNAWSHNGRIDMTVEAVSEAIKIAGEAYDQMFAEER